MKNTLKNNNKEEDVTEKSKNAQAKYRFKKEEKIRKRNKKLKNHPTNTKIKK